MGQGASGGSRLLPTPKEVIKQSNNDSKPCFKVPKVCPDPKGMVLIHFGSIWSHLDALQQRYLVKMPICQELDLRKNLLSPFTQHTWVNFWWFSDFSSTSEMFISTGKILKKTFI